MLPKIHKLFVQIFYHTTEEAYSAARRTDVVGFLEFSHNFSESMQRLLEDGHFTDDSSIMASQLNVRLDMSGNLRKLSALEQVVKNSLFLFTDQPIALYIEKGLRDTYKNFVEGLMIDCNLSKELVALPIKFEEPVFGSFHEIYRTFIAPGVIMT